MSVSDPENDPQMVRVKSEDPDDGFAWMHEDDIDPEVHERFEGEPEPEPSDDLVEVVGTKAANALATGGVTTVEEALQYEGDLEDIGGVGEATVNQLLEASDE